MSFCPLSSEMVNLLQVFKCDFKPYTVKYEHSGSPLLQKDEVSLVIHHFLDGQATRSQKVRLQFHSPSGFVPCKTLTSISIAVDAPLCF